ncbi:MAG TPA: YbaK/EbsC family protein [Candidatus Paceibacterota bacterium]|nr:YbaK/EbsC family protein [Verrucomicrobiota bacterium]HRY48778.1 YbaK/EbsC family protein [Candidatus Paceibacterota bacterium]HRZ99821.1 YbaK/EbsC family protein [Candidatus Paceibacterota bacterium]
MPATKLKKYLDENQIKYVSIIHSPAYTAQEVAQSAHLPGREMAKTVIVKIDGQMAMVVLPATRKVVLQELREMVGADTVRLASEDEFKAAFPDCDTGAMPPFGNLYGMEVYVAPSLAEDEEIAFNAGSHSELIKLAYKDFERLVKPRVLSFST